YQSQHDRGRALVRSRRVHRLRTHRRRRHTRRRGSPLRRCRPRECVPPLGGPGRARASARAHAGNGQAGVKGRARAWLRIKAVAKRHYYVLLRAPHRLFDVTIWPLVDVLLFGSIAAFVSAGKSASSAELAAGYLLSGILLWHVVYQSQIALATGFLEEAWTRNLLNLMVTPMREV